MVDNPFWTTTDLQSQVFYHDCSSTTFTALQQLIEMSVSDAVCLTGAQRMADETDQDVIMLI